MNEQNDFEQSHINKILIGDCQKVLKGLPDKSFRTCVTSPPYWGLRDYGNDGQLGQEDTPEEYVQKLVEIFREVRRTLTDDGTLWVNIADSYFVGQGGTKRTKAKVGNTKLGIQGRAPVPKGRKKKDLAGVPWILALALRDDGWFLRASNIWDKPNAMPETVTDRTTKSHEYIFLFSKKSRYYYANDRIREPQSESSAKKYNPLGRNKRSVWRIPTKPFKEAHFATFPPELITPCILAGSDEGDTVLDPFIGSGTTAQESLRLGRNFTGIELNPEYAEIAIKRLSSL